MPTVLFDRTFQGVARTLTLLQQRHEVLASNLANVETPGFRARDLDFGSALAEAFEARPPTPVAGGLPPAVVEDADAPPRADGNTVDLDLQMARLSSNGGRYTALARLLGQRIALLRQAIDGSR